MYPVYFQGQRSRSWEWNIKIPYVQDTEKTVWHRIMKFYIIAIQ